MSPPNYFCEGFDIKNLSESNLVVAKDVFETMVVVEVFSMVLFLGLIFMAIWSWVSVRQKETHSRIFSNVVFVIASLMSLVVLLRLLSAICWLFCHLTLLAAVRVAETFVLLFSVVYASCHMQEVVSDYLYYCKLFHEKTENGAEEK